MSSNAAYAKFDLSGRTALVTGGGTGLGFHISKALADSGAKVLIAGRREQVLQDAAEKLRQMTGAEVLCHTVDLASRESQKVLLKYIHEELSGIDIFVGNAGQDLLAPCDEVSDEMIDTMLRVNLTSNIELTRDLLPSMLEKQWGRIIYCSSAQSVGSSANEGLSLYTATKGGLNAFTRSVAVETGDRNITVNSLVLGLFYTDMLRENLKIMPPDVSEGLINAYTEMIATGRPGECHEVEGLIQLLASEAGSYITGSNLVIDGGLSISLRPNLVRKS